MKISFGLLYAAFSAVLFAQGTPPIQQPGSLPKRFPPEMMLSSGTTGRVEVNLRHSYCVHPNPDWKSLSVKRCESMPPGPRLIAPFTGTAPRKKPN
jgi:hypothetical protein